MSIPQGSIPLTGTIYVTDEKDTFATHVDCLGKGGYRSVLMLTDRDKITTARRKIGMLVYVRENNKMYLLKDGISNDNWVEFSGGGQSNLIVSSLEPSNPESSIVWLDPINNTLKYRNSDNNEWIDLISDLIIDGGEI